MSVNMALRGHGVSGRRRRLDRTRARLAVAVARVLNLLPPRLIRLCLRVLSRGARPASIEAAEAARRTVVAVSPAAAGAYGCLIRSIATTLVLRTRGQWPTWCVGVRAEPPFGAHAWVEAEERLVDEPGTMQTYRRLITVGPRSRKVR